jgi:biopolymer transport protein ExbB
MEAQKPNIEQPKQPQPNQAPKAATNKAVTSNVKGIKNASVVILICFVIAVLFYIFYLGSGSHFKDGNNANAPLDIFGTIYKGGVIVPLLHTLFLTVIVVSVERWIALAKAKGSGNITKFVANVKKALASKDLAKAEQLCRDQKGSVGAIVYATLIKYKELDKDTVLTKEQKLTSLQQQIEEATSLEMPSLQQNLPIVATLTTLGTLLGLLGTVIGMIRSFQALSASGAPDSTELSTGISEALVNTAFGILTAACALISYNFYTNKIDNLTYAVDELGFSIVATFAATH